MSSSTAADNAAPSPALGGTSTGTSSRWRTPVVAICLVLAGLLTTPAVVAYWGQRTLTDTERYVQTVQPLVDSPEVQDAIVTKVTSAIEQQIDVEAILDDVFSDVITDRPRLQRLTGILAGAINAQVERVTRTFVESEAFADLWVRTNTRTQQGLLRILEGDGSGAISMQGSEVVLDLDEVIAQVSQRLVDRGVPVVSRVPVPETDRQIVLLDAPALQELRTIYAFANPIATWLLPGMGLLLATAVALSRRRSRTTVIVGVLVAANALLLGLGLSVGRQLFVNRLAETVFGPASHVFYDTLLAYLLRGQQVLLVLGLLLIVLGWLAGASTVGSAVRGAATRALQGTGARIGEAAGDRPVRALGRWVTGNVGWLRGLAVALGVLVLFWGNQPTLPRLWWAVAVTLIVLAALEVLVGAGRRTPLSDEGATAPAPSRVP